jgi:hypothetical protein
MTSRTIRLLGWRVDGEAATVEARLDDDVVFSGDISLVEMTSDNESEQTAPTLFQFDIPVEFIGVKHMTISVKGTSIRFGYIVANNSKTAMGAIQVSSGPNGYVDVAEYDSNYVKDPRTNVTIDGIAQTSDRSLGKGTWQHIVNPGSIIDHDITIAVPGLLDE